MTQSFLSKLCGAGYWLVGAGIGLHENSYWLALGFFTLSALWFLISAIEANGGD